MTIFGIASYAGCRDMDEMVIFLARNYKTLKKYAPGWFERHMGNMDYDKIIFAAMSLLEGKGEGG